MWARVVECMLGCWLLVSPFIFGHGERFEFWVADYVAAALIITFGLFSYWRVTRYAHLLTVVVALGMLAYGRFGHGGAPPPALQNHLVIGLLLLMFAIVPNRASHPPEAWYGERPAEI